MTKDSSTQAEEHKSAAPIHSGTAPSSNPSSSNVYVDSDDDEDMTKDSSTQAEEHKSAAPIHSGTAPSSNPSSSKPNPAPKSTVTFQKKRSFGSFQRISRNDHRGFMTDNANPQSPNYVSPQIPTKKKRLLRGGSGSLPKLGGSLFGGNHLDPVIKRNNQKQESRSNGKI